MFAQLRTALTRPILGPRRPYQRRTDGTVGSYRRDCYWPVRLGWVWSRGQQWRPWVKDRDGCGHRMFGRFGWEVTSEVYGPYAHERGVYTGSRQRPHVFGQTVMAGPLRIVLGPRTGWHARSKADLIRLLHDTEGRLVDARDAAERRDREVARLNARIGELMQRIDVMEAQRTKALAFDDELMADLSPELSGALNDWLRVCATMKEGYDHHGPDDLPGHDRG